WERARTPSTAASRRPRGAVRGWRRDRCSRCLRRRCASHNRILRPVLAGPATTGSNDLDRALGGLYWGDNVVFEVRRAGQAEPFFDALAAETGQSGAIARVQLDDSPGVEATVIDGRVGQQERPGALLQAVRAFGRSHERS